MSALAIVIAKLKATSGVTSITGAKGIYPIDLPQDASPPCVIANIVTGDDELMLTGAGKYYRGLVTVECLAVTPDAVIALGNAVIAALEDVVSQTLAGHVANILKGNSDFTDISDDRSTYRRTVDFKVRWR